MNYSLISEAKSLINKYNNASPSLLQVYLKISYEEACQILEEINSSSSHYTTNNYDSFNFDSLDGHSFEYFCSDILSYNGYQNIKVTSGSGDYGVDILCEKRHQKYAIQCKHYSGNVGNHAVQEVLSGKILYNCDIAIVLTNSYFTSAAEETARLTNIELWDRGRLKDLYNRAIQNGYTPKKY